MSDVHRNEMLKRFLTVVEMLRKAKQEQTEKPCQKTNSPKGKQNHV